jgi:hypothetical protein
LPLAEKPPYTERLVSSVYIVLVSPRPALTPLTPEMLVAGQTGATFMFTVAEADDGFGGGGVIS